MRYSEIVAEADTAAAAQKVAQKKFKARQKIADADRKKSQAAQAYQDALRSANENRADAQATLQGQ